MSSRVWSLTVRNVSSRNSLYPLMTESTILRLSSGATDRLVKISDSRFGLGNHGRHPRGGRSGVVRESQVLRGRLSVGRHRCGSRPESGWDGGRFLAAGKLDPDYLVIILLESSRWNFVPE